MQRTPTRALALASLASLAIPALADWNSSAYGVRTQVNVVKYDWDVVSDEYAIHTTDNNLTTGASDTGSVTYGDAMASGSLSGFALHASASANPFLDGMTDVVQASSSAVAWDRVTLTNSTGGIVTIPITVSFDGSVTKHGSGSYGLEIRGSDYSGVWDRKIGDSIYGSGYGSASDTYQQASSSTQLVLSPNSSYTFKFIESVSASVSMQDYYTNPEFADFSHTVKLGWTLPTGVSYTSASNAFSPSAQPVPEPASVAAVAIGLAGALRRRSRQG